MKYNITISGTVGYWPNIGRYVSDQVSQLSGKPVTVYLNSRGGSVVDALEMYQAFRDHGDVTVYIFGFTASAATFLAMGAKKVIMSNNALFLIHKASQWMDYWGSMNADQISSTIRELEKHKDTLNKVDEIIANIYASRAAGSKETFAAKMDKAAWLTAKEVKELGLIDEILEEAPMSNLMTDDIRDEILDAQLPLPEMSQFRTDARPSFSDRVRAVLQQIGLVNDNEPQTEQYTNTMNKNYDHINTALGVESLTANEEGQVSLTAEQLSALNGALDDAETRASTAEDEANTLRSQVADLQAEVTNLKNADGADTHQNEGNADSESDAFSNPTEAFNAVSRYL